VIAVIARDLVIEKTDRKNCCRWFALIR